MYDVLSWLESSALGQLMRGSGPWTYAVVNLTHVLGISALFGAILIIDLRLMGVWRHVSLGAVVDVADPVALSGFTIAVVSGLALLSSNATEYTDNPFLLVKFPAIAVGMVNVLTLRRSRAWRERHRADLSSADRRQLAARGAISLASWLTAVAAGRMIGYW